MELRYINSLFFRRFGSHAVTITSVSPANELGILFAGMSNGCLVAWDMRYEPSPLARVVVYHAHKGAIKTLCWQPYYRLLFSGSVDGLVKIWDPSFTDFLDVSGTMTDHSALAQIFSNEKSNPIIERYKYTVQPLITEEETVSPSTSTIKLTRLVQSLGDFARPIVKISYIAHHIAVLSLDGYITVYYPDPHRDLTILKYPLFIRVARIFLGHQQLDRIKNFSTLQLGYSLQEPIHRDSLLECYNFPVNDYAYKRVMSTKLLSAIRPTPTTSNASLHSASSQKEAIQLSSASCDMRDGLNLQDIVSGNQQDNVRALSVTRKGADVDVNAPLDYNVNPLLTEPVMPTSLTVDADNTTFYVGDSNGTVHSLSVLDGKVFYKNQIKYVSNNSVLDCCFIPRESSLIATGADGTVRGIIAMTGKNYFGRMGPKGVVFTRVLHCPKRRLVEYEDLMSSRPESAQFVKQIRAKMRQPGSSLDAIHKTDELLEDIMTQTLEEQQLKTMLQKNRNQEMREQSVAETDLTALFTGQSAKKEVTARETYQYDSRVGGSMKIDEGSNSDLRRKDDNIILMDANGLILIVDSATNITLFEAMYPEVGPVPAALMAKATEIGVFLTTPVVTQPRRSLNYQFYAIAKMSLSLQEEYWILRGRFAKTMAKVDQKDKLESYMTDSSAKKGSTRAASEHKPINSQLKVQRRAKSKNSIESMDEKVSATKVSILNCYEDMQLVDMFILKLPPDLNPRGEVIIGVVRPMCVDFFKPIYKHAGQTRGIGHSKPIQLLSILPAPPLPFFEPADGTQKDTMLLTGDKGGASLLGDQSQRCVSTINVNPILHRSGATRTDDNTAQSVQVSKENTTMEDMVCKQTESVSATAQSYYKQNIVQELSNISESKTTDILSSMDEPVSEDYVQAQLQQNRLKYRNNSIKSRTSANTETDFVSAIINGDINVSHGEKEASRRTYSVQDIIKNQLDSIASISTKRSLSPNDPHSRMTAFAEMRHSIIKSLTASRARSPTATSPAGNIPTRSNQVMQKVDDLTLQELQVSTTAGMDPDSSQISVQQSTVASSRLSNLILSKRVADSQLNRINQPEAQVKQFAPYLPPEVDIVHHIVGHHTDTSGRLPLISRSGVRAAAKRKLMPPFYILSCSCDNDVYTWDARIMSRPYHHYTFSFDVLKYARILNLSQITGIVLDAASILFHKYLVDGATMATRSASLGMYSDSIFKASGSQQIRKLLLSNSRLHNGEGSESDERMIELKESNRFCQHNPETETGDQENLSASLSSKMKNVSDRVRQEKLKKEAETRQEELFTRLAHGLSATGKSFQLSAAQKGASGVRSSNYTNYHVDDADIRVRLLKLGKSGLLDKEAVKSLINQVPTETKVYTQKAKDMSFLDFDRFYVLHPDVLNMIAGIAEDNTAMEDSHLGISPHYAGKFGKNSLYNIISQSDVMPTELLCDINSSITNENCTDSRLVEAANKSGLSLDAILSEERTQSQSQFNRQVYFEIKKLSELPSASRFLAVEPCNFLLIGHEDGSLTAMVTTIKQSFQGASKEIKPAKDAVSDSAILKKSDIPMANNKAVARQTTFFRVLAGHSECVSCMCYILTDQCCYICSASIDGSILCLIHPLLGDFRLQYSIWSKFVSDLDKETLQAPNDDTKEAEDILSEAQRSPEIIEFLQGTKAFLIAGTSLGSVYFITFPLQSPLRMALFFQIEPFMQAYIKGVDSMNKPSIVAAQNDPEAQQSMGTLASPSFSIKLLDYCCDTMTIVLESGHVLQFDQVSLYYKHWLYFSNTGKVAVDPSNTSHYFSQIAYDNLSHNLILSKASSPLCSSRDTIKVPPNSPYFSSCFSAFLQHFPFKLMPQRIFSAYAQTTRKPVSADDVHEIRRREVVDESDDNKIVAAYVIFPVMLDTLRTGGDCALSEHGVLNNTTTTAPNDIKSYASVEDVLQTYNPSHNLIRKDQASVEKVFYSNGKVLERPINKALDQGQKYYDEKLRTWRYILPEDRLPDEQPRRKPPSVLSKQSEGRAVSRSKSTTPMRYINTSATAVKVSTIIQRSVSLGMSSKRELRQGGSQLSSNLGSTRSSAPNRQQTNRVEEQLHDNPVPETLGLSTRRVEKASEDISMVGAPNKKSTVCIGYASGLIRIYSDVGQILEEFSYDSPACSFRAIRADDVGKQIILSMEPEMRVIAASTIWMGFSDGRLTMERCSALLGCSIS